MQDDDEILFTSDIDVSERGYGYTLWEYAFVLAVLAAFVLGYMSTQ